jgi:nucleoside-diphosphate-sugar epimerase
MARILVTGGAGRLGRHVVAEISPHHDVTVLDHIAPTADLPNMQASILDRDAIAPAFEGQETVIHLAAHDADADASENGFIRTNVEGTFNVFDLARRAGVRRLVHCSSVAALNISHENPPEYLPIDRNHPCRPTGAYGLSKQMGEAVARRFAMFGDMEIVCLRPTLVVYDWIVHTLITTSATVDGPPVPAMPKKPEWQGYDEVIPGSRSWVSGFDAARAFRAAVECPDPGFGPWFVAASDNHTHLPTLHLVEREFGAIPQDNAAERFAADPRASIYDTRPTTAALGWEPQERWADVIARLFGPDGLDDPRSLEDLFP